MVRMSTHDEFADDKVLESYLAEALYKGRLAIILGAGISSAFGLPSWDDLVLRLEKKRGEHKNESLERRAELIKLNNFGGDTQKFKTAVHKALYKDVAVDFTELQHNATLASIAALVMNSRRGRASSVVTFNWDDLLEQYLMFHGFVTESIFEPIHWNATADVVVYHPHGFLPFDPAQRQSNQIVFDQNSYITLVGNESNPWRQRLLSIMRTHFCLFIGLSGRDNNLDSLLIAARDQHASKLEQTLYWGATFSTSKSLASLWRERGVYLRQVQNFGVKLPEFLFGVCQRAATLSS